MTSSSSTFSVSTTEPAASPGGPASDHRGGLRKRTLRFRVLALVAAINVVTTVAACSIAYYFQEKAFLAGVDRILTAGAVGAQHVYGDEFQAKMLAGAKLAPDQERAHLERISDLANHLNLTYIGSLVRRDGKFYYTITSSPRHEFEDGTYDRCWTVYDDATPALAAAFEDGKVRYEEHEDRYGSFRSVYVPYRMAGSGQVDYVYVADMSLAYIYGHVHRTLTNIVVAGVAVTVVSLWLAWILAGRVAAPLARLAGTIRTVAADDFTMHEAEHADLQAIGEDSLAEVAEVAAAFCRMELRLAQYLVELQATTAERERIASELSIAHDIQFGLLPKKLPQLAGCDVFARVIPAKEVGGDLFDVRRIGENRLLLVVADVSGKGVPGGMFMAVTKTLLDAAVATCMTPDEIVRFLNDHLAAENDAFMFVTMFLAVFDAESGRLEYTNAGHNPPYIRRADGKLDTLGTRHGMALGITPDQDYASSETTLAEGDVLVVFSDGITEAQDPSESLFSEARLEAYLIEIEPESAGEVATKVIDRVMKFQGAAPQADDITILALRYTAAVPAEVLA
jgi:sigma-B regulation protein RsbU (phosphoserine phosphatase)